MKQFIFAIGLILLLTGFSFAEDIILLEGVGIRVGDKKVDILPKIEKVARLKESNDVRGVFMISDRNGAKNIGMIQFVNDKITVINKNWGVFGKTEGLEITKALIGAISSASERENTVHVTVHRTFQPGTTVEGIELSFGRREITVSLIELHGDTSIQVRESLW